MLVALAAAKVHPDDDEYDDDETVEEDEPTLNPDYVLPRSLSSAFESGGKQNCFIPTRARRNNFFEVSQFTF